MRTLRLSLAGVVILALLGGLGGAVVAQDGEPTFNPDMLATALVSGSETCQFTEFGSMTETDIWANVRRDYKMECVVEMSDPRANGTYTESDFVGDGYDSESAQPSVAALGHVTLVNDEGSWSGHESAVWDDSGIAMHQFLPQQIYRAPDGNTVFTPIKAKRQRSRQEFGGRMRQSHALSSFLATPLSLGEPIRPVALRPYLSDKYAAYRTDSSLAHTLWQFKETEPERTAPFFTN